MNDLPPAGTEIANTERLVSGEGRYIGKSWGEFILAIRTGAGQSQKSFGEGLGVVQQTVALWEAGGLPKKQIRRRLAEFFELTQEEQLMLNNGEDIGVWDASEVASLGPREQLLGAYAVRIERGEPPLTELDFRLITSLISLDGMSQFAQPTNED